MSIYKRRSVQVHINAVTKKFLRQIKVSPSDIFDVFIDMLHLWSYTVFAVQHVERKEVFIGYIPTVESLGENIVFRLSENVQWVRNNALDGGYGSLSVKYLSVGQTKSDSKKLINYFINDYMRAGYDIKNDDWLTGDIPYQITIDVSHHDYKVLLARAKAKGYKSIESGLAKEISRNNIF